MAITVDDGQLGLAARSGVACVPLVVLETYSDRDARTVDDTYYWTRGHGLIYQWNGSTGVWFEPLIQSISPVVRGFSYLPDASQYSTREGLRFSVDTTEKAGDFIWNLLNTSQLIGARITLGSLLIDLTEDAPYNLSSLGRVHTVRWRGEITSVPLLDAETMTVEFVAETEEVAMHASRNMAGVATAHPLDAGKPYPVPIGNHTVDALWYDAGYEVVLREDLNSGSTSGTFYFDTSNPYPPPIFDYSGGGSADTVFGGYIQFDGDREVYTTVVVDGSGLWATVNGITAALRGNLTAGTRAQLQPRTARYAISGAPVSGVVAAWASTIDNERWDLISDPDAIADKAHITNMENGDAGGHVAMLSIGYIGNSPQKNAQLVDRLNASIEVEVEGSYTVGTTPTVEWDNSTAGAAPFNVFGESHASTVYKRQTKYVWTMGTGNITQTNTSAELFTLGLNKDGARADSRHMGISLGVTITGPVVLEFTFNFDSAVLDALHYMTIYANPDPVWLGVFDEYLAVDVSKLTTGDQTIRFHCLASSISSIYIEWILNDETVNADVRLIGDWVSYAITPNAPVGAHPIDVVELVVDDFLPTAAVSYDATTFATAKTNTAGLSLSTDLSRFPTLGEFLAGVGFNARINFLLSETYTGTELKAFAALTSHLWPAATVAIGDEYAELKATLRPITEIANRFTALYDQGGGSAGSEFETYRKSLGASSIDNTLSGDIADAVFTTSESEYGIRPALELPFQMVDDEDVIKDVLGYYAKEAMRAPVARFSCIVPYWIGYGLEAGDVVSIQPPWEASAVKCRVTQTVFNFDENGIGLNLEEAD